MSAYQDLDDGHADWVANRPEAEHPDEDDALGLDHHTRMGRDDAAEAIAEVVRLQGMVNATHAKLRAIEDLQ